MRRIRIKRKKETFNQNFTYKILVDNKQVTKLKNGEEKVIELYENAQYLEAKISGGSSKKLAIDNVKSNQKILVFGDRFKNKYLKYAGVLIPLISLTFILEHTYYIIKILGGILFIAYLLFIILILIFQKKKWIYLQLIN